MTPEIIEAYLDSQGGKYALGDNGMHMVLECPWCGKHGHMYVNIAPRGKGTLGGFKCFKCEEGGRDFARLYAAIEGLDYKDALIALAREASGVFNRLRPARPKTPAVATLPQQTNPWPIEYTPCWDGSKWQMPTYLEERGLHPKIAAEYQLGFCASGEYAGRIILPIDCPVNKSWTARAIDPDREPRYKAGPGAGRLLFGWRQAQGATTLVINEGPFDAMAVRQVGLRSVAIMGLKLREYQMELIRAMRCKRIVWMLDESALSDALKNAPKLPGDNMIAAPLGFKDAAQAVEKGHPEAIRQAVKDSTSWNQAHLEKILDLVRKTKQNSQR